MATVRSPISSRSRVTSRISTACALNSPPPSLSKQFGLDPCRFELAQMLLRQPLVGRQQEDAVQFVLAAVPG